MERYKDLNTQLKLAKVFKAVISAGLVAPVFVSVSACEKAKPVVEEAQATATVPATIETAPPTTETVPETTAEIEKVDAPEILGLTFNQETKSYFNEAGVEVGIYIEEAVKINDEMKPAIGLKPEAIRNILNDNKEKGIFECPWPFDFQKDKGIEIVELFNNPLNEQKVFKHLGAYPPTGIGIKYSEPIGLYAPFDVQSEFASDVFKNIPDKEGSDFYSTQPYKGLGLATSLAYKSKEMDHEKHGSINYNFIDWKPRIELGEVEVFGNNDIYLQKILEGIKCGDFLGTILPNTSDFNFLDFCNNKDFYENPGQFQGRLSISDFSDDYSQPTSSLGKMLKYLNKAGQEIPVGVWP